MSNKLRNVYCYDNRIEINGLALNKNMITSFESKALRRGGIFGLIAIIYILSLIFGIFSGDLNMSTGIGIVLIIGLFSFLSNYYAEAWRLKINVGNKVYKFTAISEDELETFVKLERCLRS